MFIISEEFLNVCAPSTEWHVAISSLYCGSTRRSRGLFEHIVSVIASTAVSWLVATVSNHCTACKQDVYWDDVTNHTVITGQLLYLGHKDVIMQRILKNTFQPQFHVLECCMWQNKHLAETDSNKSIWVPYFI